MSYNMRLLPHFILLFTFLYGLLSGVFIIRSGEFRKPFSRTTFVQGRKAMVMGGVLIGVGLFAGWMLYRILNP